MIPNICRSVLIAYRENLEKFLLWNRECILFDSVVEATPPHTRFTFNLFSLITYYKNSGKLQSELPRIIPYSNDTA